MTHAPNRRVPVGRVAGVFGVRGWIKIFSYTRPRDAILTYSPWLIEREGEWRSFEMIEGRLQGKGLVARLAGYEDRDAAATLIGAEIAVSMSQFPALSSNEYYWAELEGLRVVNLAGQELGQVDHLFETGANDVLVVRGEREYLIPVGGDYIRRIDRDSGIIQVDWDAEDV